MRGKRQRVRRVRRNRLVSFQSSRSQYQGILCPSQRGHSSHDGHTTTPIPHILSLLMAHITLSLDFLRKFHGTALPYNSSAEFGGACGTYTDGQNIIMRLVIELVCLFVHRLGGKRGTGEIGLYHALSSYDLDRYTQ